MEKIIIRKKLTGIVIGLALTAILVSVALVGTNAWSPKNVRTQEALQVESKTSAFKVTQANRDENNKLHLTLKNESSKGITAYIVSIVKPKSTFDFTEDFIYGGKSITPGEMYTIDIPLPSGTKTKDASFQQEEISPLIVGVVFEDKTVDGDTVALAEIRDNRLGEKLQLERLIPLLEEATSLQDFHIDLDKLKSKISALPNPPEENRSEAVLSGFRHNKESMIERLQRFKDGLEGLDEKQVRERLISLKDSYKQLYARL